MGILVLIPVEILVVMLISLGMALTAKVQGNWWADFVDNLTPLARLILIKPLQLSVKVSRYVAHHFGLNWPNLQSFGVAFFGGLYQWASGPITMALEWPYYLVKFQFWLLDVGLPRAIQAAVHGLHGVTKYVERKLPTIERTIIKFPKLSKAQAKALIAGALAATFGLSIAQLRWIASHFHALTHAIPKALDVPTWKDLTRLRNRVDRLAKKVTPAAIAAAVVLALVRMGLGRLRCNNVKRTLPRLCGMDTSLLDSLLADSLLVVGSISIVELTQTCQTVLPALEWGIGGFVREAPSSFQDVPQKLLDEALAIIPGF